MLKEAAKNRENVSLDVVLAKFHEDRIICAQFRNVEIRENEALET